MKLNETLKEKLSELVKMRTTGDDHFYRNYFDFIEQEGRFTESKALTSNEAKFIRKRMRSTNRDFHKEKCHENSFHLLLSDSESRISYVEGVIYESKHQVIMKHAWNEINGKIVDTTLDKFGELTGITYFGVPLPTNYVRGVILGKDMTSGIIDRMLKEKYV